MFETLLASNRAAANVLESDKKAAEGREFYDDGYFEAFAAGTLASHGAATERFDRRGRRDRSPAPGSRRAGRPSRPRCRELRADRRPN